MSDSNKEIDKEFDKVWSKLSLEECNQCLIFSLTGLQDMKTGIVYMGSVAYDRYWNFKKEMIEKYKDQ